MNKNPKLAQIGLELWYLGGCPFDRPFIIVCLAYSSNNIG